MNQNTIKKGFLVMLALALCFSCVAVPLYARGQPEKAPIDANTPIYKRLTFQAGAGDSPSIACVRSDDLCYVYLPSLATMDRVSISMAPGKALFLNGIPLRDGMSCEAFPLDEPLELSADGLESARLVFLASANVSTLFVNTDSGSMSAIHNDKTLKEKASLALYSPDGSREYRSMGTDLIRGRGNSSWFQKKKGYNLYLNYAIDLMGMGAAKKWALIPNPMDESNLRNWLAYMLAGTIGRYSGFAPQCGFVDLYLNGKYNGLYLLTEKIEIHPNRLDIPRDSWLFTVDQAQRFIASTNAFELGGDLGVKVLSPDVCSDEQLEKLKEHLLDFQATLLSEDGVSVITGKSWDEYIDMDSFARKYLVEEIVENYDAGSCSQYFYWNASDGRLYAGPCWDYDISLGNHALTAPNCFIALREWKTPHIYTPWFAGLWRHQEFHDLVIDLYKSEFLPVLRDLMDTGLDEKATEIEAASRLNSIRWQSIFNVSKYDGSYGHLREFLTARIDFLNSAWIDGVDYKTVTFDFNGFSPYRIYSLPAGSSCEDLPSPRRYGLKDLDGWLLEDGTPFDPSATLDSDMTLYGYDRSVKE